MVTEQGDGGAERFGGGIDATLTATGSKACGLVETERELVFNEEVLKGSGQRASGSARRSCPFQECLGVSRVTGGEERSHGGDELAGPADGHAFGRVVGERSKPPRRFGDGGGETVGLVAGPVGVCLPAAAAEPVGKPSGLPVALAAGAGRFGLGPGARAGAAPAGVGPDQAHSAAPWAYAFRHGGRVAASAGQTACVGAAAHQRTAVDTGPRAGDTPAGVGLEYQDAPTVRARVAAGSFAVRGPAPVTQLGAPPADPATATNTLADPHLTWGASTGPALLWARLSAAWPGPLVGPPGWCRCRRDRRGCIPRRCTTRPGW